MPLYHVFPEPSQLSFSPLFLTKTLSFAAPLLLSPPTLLPQAKVSNLLVFKTTFFLSFACFKTINFGVYWLSTQLVFLFFTKSTRVERTATGIYIT